MLNNCRDILTVDELCEVLRIGKNIAYQLLRSGKIKSIKVGNIYKIPKYAVIDYIKST